MLSVRQELWPAITGVASVKSGDGSWLTAGGRHPQDRRAVCAGDDDAIGAPGSSAQSIVREIGEGLRRSALNVHLLKLVAAEENDPAAIVGPGRGRLIAFRARQRADLDAIDRANEVPLNAIFGDCGEHHPAAVR